MAEPPGELMLYQDGEVRFNFIAERAVAAPAGADQRWADGRICRVRAIGLLDRDSVPEFRLTAAQRERAVSNIAEALRNEVSPYYDNPPADVVVDPWPDLGAGEAAWDAKRGEVRGPGFAIRPTRTGSGREDEDEDRPDEFLYQDHSIRVFYEAKRHYLDGPPRTIRDAKVWTVIELGTPDYWRAESFIMTRKDLTRVQMQAALDNIEKGMLQFRGSLYSIPAERVDVRPDILDRAGGLLRMSLPNAKPAGLLARWMRAIPGKD